MLALMEWPHGVQYFDRMGWCDCKKPDWIADVVYRGKTAPAVTIVWFNRYPDNMFGPYSSRNEADLKQGMGRIDVLRIDTCNGVSTAYLEGLNDE